MNPIDIYYEFPPGVLRWKITKYAGVHGKLPVAYAGDIAGGFSYTTKRWVVRLNGKQVERARVIWEMHGRTIPKGFLLDHIDRNPLNDRIDNLRLASKSQNAWNAGRNKNNTSGYKGVSYSKKTRKYLAQMQVRGKRIRIGLFNTPQEASSAYIEYSKRLHGSFSYIY